MTQLYWNIWITLRNFDVNDLKTIQWQSFLNSGSFALPNLIPYYFFDIISHIVSIAVALARNPSNSIVQHYGISTD